MTMSDIDMKLIGLYKFEIYYNEQDGEIEHGHNPYTFVILADSMDRLAYGIAQRERDWRHGRSEKCTSTLRPSSM